MTWVHLEERRGHSKRFHNRLGLLGSMKSLWGFVNIPASTRRRGQVFSVIVRLCKTLTRFNSIIATADHHPHGSLFQDSILELVSQDSDMDKVVVREDLEDNVPANQ